MLHHHVLCLGRGVRRSIALPGMLQTLFGYDALASGLVMSPSGVSSLGAMVLVGVLWPGRSTPAGWSRPAWW